MPLDDIRHRIGLAESAAGRPPGSVTLIAVSKVQPPDRIRAVLDAGQRVFGENRVQEAQGRWPALRDTFGPIGLHLIGPLQTNKARAAAELFDAIHSVDRPRLVDTLARLAQDRGASPDIFLQVNTGAEPQKAGCLPADTDALVAAARAADLPVTGLMCIPPEGRDPEPDFRLLASLAAISKPPSPAAQPMSASARRSLAHASRRRHDRPKARAARHAANLHLPGKDHRREAGPTDRWHLGRDRAHDAVDHLPHRWHGKAKDPLAGRGVKRGRPCRHLSIAFQHAKVIHTGRPEDDWWAISPCRSQPQMPVRG